MTKFLPKCAAVFGLLAAALAPRPSHADTCLTLPPSPQNEVNVFLSVTWGVPLGVGIAPEYSYFRAKIESNPTPAIPVGAYPAWCFDAGTTIDPGGPDYYQTPGTEFAAKLISSCDPLLNSQLPNHPNVKVDQTTWNKVNWLINHRLEACNGEIPTMWEVQNVIYALFGQTAEPGIAVRPSVINCLLAGANANGNFVPQCGQKQAVVMNIDLNFNSVLPDDVQLLFLEVPWCPPVTLTKGLIGACYPTVDAALAAAKGVTGVSQDCGATLSASVVDGSVPCNTTISVIGRNSCGSVSEPVIYTVRIDSAPPELKGVPADTTAECNAIPERAQVTAFDVCVGAVEVTYSEEIIGSGCTYTIKRTWSATDGCNPTSATQTITVQDTTAPILSGVPSDTTVECDAVPGAPIVTATDNCVQNVEVKYSETRVNGNCPNNYKLIRTWSATDGCNPTSATQTITVQDTTGPVFSGVGANGTVECPAKPVFSEPSASDKCGGTVEISSSDETTQLCGGSYKVKRTWTAKDVCGKTTTATQTITVLDTIPPTISCPDDAIVACGGSTDPGTTGIATATDTCSGTVTPTYKDTVSVDQSGNTIITRVWSAKDDCSNSSKCTQKITVLKCPQYETYTPGGWCASPNGNNVAMLLSKKFSAVYPGGCVKIGGLKYIKFTSATAIDAFVLGGTPSKLANNYTNPTFKTEAGELAGQVLALQLNVDFSNAGFIKPGLPALKVAPGNKLAGWTVTQVLAAANTALGGGALPPGCTYADLTNLLGNINGNYDNGTSNNGFLIP